MVNILSKKFKKEIIRISFIKSSFSKVRDQLRGRIFSSLNEKWKEEDIQPIQNSIISEIERKSDNKFVDVLIWKPKSADSDLVVFFTNMSDGWYTLLYNYARTFNEEIISVKFSHEKAKYPVYSFECKKGEEQRLIRSMKEWDKWEFVEKGDIRDFENAKNYKRRRIADRINNEIIVDYLNKNGINIEQEEFWTSIEAVRFWTNLKE